MNNLNQNHAAFEKPLEKKVIVLRRNQESMQIGAIDEQGRKPFDPVNGHEAILKTLIKAGREVCLTFVDSTQVFGRISQFDSSTITIYPDDNDGMPETFFKHNIRSFTAATSKAR